ncbi:MAG: hypothetical protein HQ521_12850 [Bacteroidetes bacterium]|nr:hypothetical protein [Bacteroidota bacterium]
MALTLVNGPNEISYTRNIINVVVQLEADPEYIDVYALCNIYDTFTNVVATLFARPDDSYNVSYDISGVLDAITDFSFIGLSITSEKNTGAALRYWCEVVQYADGTPIDSVNIGLVGETPSLFSFKGGVSLQHISTNIFNLVKTNNMFLTWLDGDKVTIDQPYYLYYLHQYDSAFITAEAEVFYSDGTSDTKTLVNFGEVFKYYLLKVAVGFNQQNLGDLQPTKTPIYYKVWLSGTFADPFTFTIDDSYVPFPKYISFANSLGGFNYAVLKGKNESEIIPTASLTEKTNSAGKGVSSFGHLLENKISASTGHISVKNAEAFADIFTTCHTYEKLNNRFIQISVSTKSKLKYSEVDNLISIPIEYSRAYINRNFTPDATS